MDTCDFSANKFNLSRFTSTLLCFTRAKPMNINLIQFCGREGGVYTIIAAERSMFRVKKQKSRKQNTFITII